MLSLGILQSNFQLHYNSFFQLPFISISQHIGTTVTTNEIGPQSASNVMVVLSQPNTTCEVPCMGPHVFQIKLFNAATTEKTAKMYHRRL